MDLPNPTPVPTSTLKTGKVSGVGDPHLTNLFGQHFDLNQAGFHTLIAIPRWSKRGSSMLTVDAEATRFGGSCADLYFTDLNITGRWVNVRHGVHFSVHSASQSRPVWRKFGTVQIKVAHGHTDRGTPYLNFYVKGLNKVKLTVGGLLGDGDHAAMVPDPSCKKSVTF